MNCRKKGRVNGSAFLFFMKKIGRRKKGFHLTTGGIRAGRGGISVFLLTFLIMDVPRIIHPGVRSIYPRMAILLGIHIN